MMLPDSVLKTLARFRREGYEAYVVGGCVRDALMGVSPKDFDVATDAEPLTVKEIFSDVPVIETGIRHGTVTVLMDACPIEVTTYRVDGEYLDRRRPSFVHFTDSVREDLARRDFTVNAMAYSPETGLVDPFGGREDLFRKCIRCVGDPLVRLNEDALRILRALRFASTLGFTIDPATREALFAKKETILDVAAERITAEFSKMLLGQGVADILAEYAEILAVFIPELRPAIGFEQKNPYHDYDVYTHTVKVVENTPPVLTIRLAAFFHDIAKPSVYTADERGIGHFYGHQAQSAEIASQIMTRMKFDGETKTRVRDLVLYHDITIRPDRKSVRRVLNRFPDGFFPELLALKRADIIGQNAAMQDRLAGFDVLEEIYEEILRSGDCYALKDLAVKGADLLSAGIPEGKTIGLALKDCLRQVIAEQLPNTREELLRYCRDHYSEKPD